MTGRPVLSVRDLRVSIGSRPIVRGISFDVDAGETVGVVGESGSGKSMTVLSATGLFRAAGAQVTGSSALLGTELVGASRRTLRAVHGDRVGFVFQDPATSLNPLLTIEQQLVEGPRTHRGLTPRAARRRALELLEAVGIREPERRLAAYPHQLSGGQKQRVMIAIAIACDPTLLVADEPTTALDVTTQAQIIDLVAATQERTGMAVVWISHDLGVIGQVADRVSVLQHGEAVEQAGVHEVFDAPRHEYTRTLLAARPVLGRDQRRPIAPDADRVLSVADLDVRFRVASPGGRHTVRAVSGVSFEVRRGETLGIVGESGSGKSTVANALTGLARVNAGRVTLRDADVLAATGARARGIRRSLAMVFQDPFSALDPRMRVEAAIAEPLVEHRLVADGAARTRRVRELLELVALPAEFAARYPHELSGGQRQRVCIARALACEPELVIFDESTASLDVSIQARVIELLIELQERLGTAYLFIGHDLAVVERMSHRIAVMRNGEIVESAPSAELYRSPRTDYTRRLIAAIPPERPA
ncbi:ABC transporter ATP-binding protein [Galbitalea sp. SE-J8]|uniref:ABC transporter ATP-binding protein n=1 Tax=Galbitalea sp. SE-J8 TaxID=3054952 RepID=UPI00259C768B|nr:ABC transporter ATP-binding protein [Galbitalea sp. SE-J8]MDM4761500.1 ABC transporter ATP-binding protein [Galbitalea sp. SE-J8]